MSRPPLANDRLEQRPDGRLTLRLKTRWRDRTTHILMERSELIERLVPLIPPPRAHQKGLGFGRSQTRESMQRQLGAGSRIENVEVPLPLARGEVRDKG